MYHGERDLAEDVPERALLGGVGAQLLLLPGAEGR